MRDVWERVVRWAARPIAPWTVVVVSLVAWGTGVFGVWRQVVAEHAAAPPSCFGLGFGCELRPSTAAVLVGLWAAPGVVAAVGVGTAGWVLARTDRWRNLGAAAVAVASVAAAVGLLLAAWLAASSVAHAGV